MSNNVLILMSDEHTRSVMGAYGNDLVHTPALDELAAQGVRFDNAYTPSPICIPARASFATGTSVFEHRCWSSAEPYYGQQQSWMHRLRARGHEVTSIGKLHYRSADDDTGFSESLHPMYLANGGRGWPQGLQRRPMGEFADTVKLAEELGPGETSYTQYDRDITATAVDWLGRHNKTSETPWVLFVSFICPHFPLSAPQQFFDMYQDLELPQAFDRDESTRLKHPVIDAMRDFWDYANHFNPETEQLGLQNYYGLCSFLDDNVAQVLAALKGSGQGDNTQIIYTSDHGDQIGNHGIWCKSFMYEDSVGIPMTISGPGIDASTNPTPVSLTDLASTIEMAVGADISPVQEAWQGRPLQSFIDSPEPDRLVISEYHDGGSPCGCFMLRKGPLKLMYFADDNPPLLFDLQQDPQEMNNLAEDPAQLQLVHQMTQELYRILDPQAVSDLAFEDQARMVELLGGMENILAMRSFNHTPLD